MALVRVEDRQGVWLVLLDRPPVNALDLELARAAGEAVAAAETDASCRGIVLSGAGRAFSAGIDVKRVPAYDAATRAEMLRTVNATMTRLYGFAKPAVAALNGHALGGAFVLALGCDVRLAAAGDHRLGLTEASAGIPFPAVPLVVVEAEVTGRAARLATLAGTPLGPAEALAAGLVDDVVAGERLVALAVARAAALAALPAYAAVKAQLRGRALERMRRIVETGEEPLLARWLPSDPP